MSAREKLSKMRDEKLKQVRKELSIGRGRPAKPGNLYPRENLSKMRDEKLERAKKEVMESKKAKEKIRTQKLKQVRKELDVGRGRPKKATTTMPRANITFMREQLMRQHIMDRMRAMTKKVLSRKK